MNHQATPGALPLQHRPFGEPCGGAGVLEGRFLRTLEPAPYRSFRFPYTNPTTIRGPHPMDHQATPGALPLQHRPFGEPCGGAGVLEGRFLRTLEPAPYRSFRYAEFAGN